MCDSKDEAVASGYSPQEEVVELNFMILVYRFCGWECGYSSLHVLGIFNSEKEKLGISVR